MFGYVRINKMDLTFREFDIYKGYYCGLCKSLKENRGMTSTLSLNYDITFLILLISSLYKIKPNMVNERCLANPLKKKMKITSEITEYAADMNILLTYYKLEDNVKDEKRFRDKIVYYLYRPIFKKSHNKYTAKSNYIKNRLNELHTLEMNKISNIDEVSNVFGDIMSEIFTYKEDEYTNILKNIGFNIGKYVYVLDAYEDLEKDHKKGRYNPFMEYISKKDELKLKVDNLMMYILGFLSQEIDKLHIKNNIGIIDNIVYSGMYLRYKNILKGSDKGVKQPSVQ
jgi:hypothetical protein